jgi:hypothetical protein
MDVVQEGLAAHTAECREQVQAGQALALAETGDLLLRSRRGEVRSNLGVIRKSENHEPGPVRRHVVAKGAEVVEDVGPTSLHGWRGGFAEQVLDRANLAPTGVDHETHEGGVPVQRGEPGGRALEVVDHLGHVVEAQSQQHDVRCIAARYAAIGDALLPRRPSSEGDIQHFCGSAASVEPVLQESGI